MTRPAKERGRINKTKQAGMDPRQQLLLKYYLDPESETFSNLLQSALRAGYSREYAENLSGLMPEWFAEALSQVQMLVKAEKNLGEFLDLNTKSSKMLGSVVIEEDDSGKLKVKADVTKFVLERLNKKKYSQRTEQGGPNGGPITVTWDNGESDDKDPV